MPFIAPFTPRLPHFVTTIRSHLTFILISFSSDRKWKFTIKWILIDLRNRMLFISTITAFISLWEGLIPIWLFIVKVFLQSRSFLLYYWLSLNMLYHIKIEINCIWHPFFFVILDLSAIQRWEIFELNDSNNTFMFLSFFNIIAFYLSIALYRTNLFPP